MWNHNLAQTNL